MSEIIRNGDEETDHFVSLSQKTHRHQRLSSRQVSYRLGLSEDEPITQPNIGQLSLKPSIELESLDQSHFASTSAINPKVFSQSENLAGVSKTNATRVSPEQVPSIVDWQEEDQQIWYSHIYRTSHGFPPPLSTSRFIALDDGNSSPKFLRSSLYSVPATSSLLASSHLPFALVVQPFAQLLPQDSFVHETIHSSSTTQLDCTPDWTSYRCTICGAYVNPFTNFVDGGSKFICNFCGKSSPVATDYYAPLNPLNGRRTDISERPELLHGSIDFILPSKPDLKLSSSKSDLIWKQHWLFAIDTSEESYKANVVKCACDSIRSALYLRPEASDQIQNWRIAIVTFNKELCFFRFNMNSYEMIVMSDLKNPFVPLSNMFVDAYDCRSSIDRALDFIADSFGLQEPAFGTLSSLLPSIFMIGESSICGKVFVFLSSLPTWGPGNLRYRETRQNQQSTEASPLISAVSDYYPSIAQRLAACGISVNLFLLCHTYIDVATLGSLSLVTGGETYHYSNFQFTRDSVSVDNDLWRSTTRESAQACVLKVRCSRGLKLKQYIGAFQQSVPAEIEIADISSEQSILAHIEVDENEFKLSEKSNVFIQCSVFYIASNGSKRVRCHNLSLAVSNDFAEVFRKVDFDTCVIALTKNASMQLLEASPALVRSTILSRCIDILSAYRFHCALSTPPAQLLLPETLKLLPLMTLCLLKHCAFRSNMVSHDIRVNAMRSMRSMSSSHIIVYLYPRIYMIYGSEEEPALKRVRASFKEFIEGSAYIITNGFNIYIWIHRNISIAWLQQLFCFIELFRMYQ